MTVAAQLFLVDITEEDVMCVIDKLKICKSPGPDKIYPRILKEVKEVICKPLCAIFNLSLRTGRVVSEWKLANVTPLFKKGINLILVIIDQWGVWETSFSPEGSGDDSPNW